LAARENREASEPERADIVAAESLSIKWDSNRSPETIVQALVDVFPQFVGMPILSAE